MAVPKSPEFGNVPEADQAGKAQESIGAVDERARGSVVIAAGGTAETYTVVTDSPYLVLLATVEAFMYGAATFDSEGILNGYATPGSGDFTVPAGLPWKIRSPGLGNDVEIVAATTATEIFILEVD